MHHSLCFKRYSKLSLEMGVSRETLRKKLKEIDGLETGKRQLIYLIATFLVGLLFYPGVLRSLQKGFP